MSSHFDGLVIPSKEVVDGVPILRQPPFSLIGVKVKDGHLREVAIDVTKVSVKMSEVAEWYERYVAAPGVQYDENHGETAYKFFDEGILRLIARPETTSVDAADGRILPRKAGPPRLPHPQAVAGLYGGVKPLFADRLAGRRGGGPFNAHYLLPACVAWYTGGRPRNGVLSKKTNLAVAKILNEHLLGPCGIQTLPEYRVSSHDSIWRNTKKVIPVSEWLAVCAFVFDRIDGKPSPAPAANALRGGALLVPEDPGEPFRFTLDFGDAARGPHRRPEANGQPPHAGEALDKERDPS